MSLKNKNLRYVFVSLIGFFTFLALAFTLCECYDRHDSVLETGFHFLDFHSVLVTRSFSWATIVIGTVSWLTLFAGLSTLVFSIIMMSTKKDLNKVAIGLCSTCIILSILYMICGFVFASLPPWGNAFTLAFIPFIILSGLYVPFMIFAKKIDNSLLVNNSTSNSCATAPENTPKGAIYNITGAVGKTLVVYPTKCVISTKATFRSVVAGNFTDGEKTIYFADLTGIQFKRGSTILLGYLQLETASTQATRRNGNWAANYESENSFTFESNINTLMEEVAQYIKDRLDDYKTNKNTHSPQAVQQMSLADELLKFKQLLDAGVITQEEFDNKKAELLK